MYERFTEEAREVMRSANKEAQVLNHEYIGTEHVLLAILKHGQNNGCKLLESTGSDLNQINCRIKEWVHAGPNIVSMGQRPQTPRVKKVIEYAMDEARLLERNYTDVEHILLGLVRHEEGTAAQILGEFGITLEDMRRRADLLIRGELGNQEMGDLLAKLRKITGGLTNVEALREAIKALEILFVLNGTIVGMQQRRQQLAGRTAAPQDPTAS